ncbi:MAG: hypothetical protein QM759_10525 [Terricaulis sp.]
MAGGIDISKEAGVSIGGGAFRTIIEQIRSEIIRSGGEAHIRKIYHGNDEACLNFISVRDQDQEGFNLFYRAAVAASESAARTHPEDSNIWSELLTKLRADPRHAA